TVPDGSTTTAPMGTSPVSRAARASASAARMGSRQASYDGCMRCSGGREADGLVELRPEAKPAGHVGQHLVGVQVVVVDEHAHVHGVHAEVAEQVEVAGRGLLVLVLGLGKAEELHGR